MTRTLSTVSIALALAACGVSENEPGEPDRQWLAGDHHIHSRYSVLWDRDVSPPVPLIGSHGVYPVPLNALMAKYYGLAWTVATDHGGRQHAKLNLDQAYPNLLVARATVPEVIQFFGVELNAPGADHASVIVPHTPDEATQVYAIESRFDKRDTGFGGASEDPGRDSEARMLEALGVMSAYPEPPLVIANHPSRTARPGATYGLTTPAELRAWRDAAPAVAVGMIGAPGHQAVSLNPDGSTKPQGRRGQYRNQPTRGGFDPMTARLGGFWDSMLGEGRPWWITANSDSHEHFTDGGVDFWPGEYSKTYVYADKTHADILDGIRAGRMFVTTGDLIAELEVTVQSGNAQAAIGERLVVTEPGSRLRVDIRARDPQGPNHNGDTPHVSRIDLIVGAIDGPLMNAAQDTNPTTRVERRFEAADWTRDGELLSMSHELELDGPLYLRVRGTSTTELEPEPDPPGEDPWSDLWFYSNPIFVFLDPRP